MNFNVLHDETLEDLQINGLYILQKKNTFRFGMDAVLLSNFVSAGKGSKVLILGLAQDNIHSSFCQNPGRYCWH